LSDRAIRITAVPRADHPNSGLQAMSFAQHFGDEVWALPATGPYIGGYGNVRFFILDKAAVKRFMPIRLVRAFFFVWLALAALFSPRRLFFVHSFIFAAPLYYLRRSYCLFFHGSDHRFLSSAWGQKVAGGAIASYGVGFGLKTDLVTVHEAPNIFVPVPPQLDAGIRYDLVFVLRHAPVKNPYYPLELAEQIGRRLDLRIAVLGVSETELPPAERDRLKRLRAGGVDIAYLGRQPYEEVVRLMQAGHIIMVPSQSEGIPKVVLEGMAQGMRALASERLSFPAAIDKRVRKVALDDWETLARIVEAERSSARSAQNVEFARDYLASSQSELAARYEEVYAAHRSGHRERRRA
jgi:hypothetical protein